MAGRGGDRDDRGAVAAMTAVVSLVILVAASFAVDLGMQRVVRSDMQALADVVALDAARLLNGRTAGDIRDGIGTCSTPTGVCPPLDDAVDASVARNGDGLGRIDAYSATLIFLTDGAHGQKVPVTYVDPSDHTTKVREATDAEVPDAVYVEATGSVAFALSGVLGVDRGSATRAAFADNVEWGCVKLGSWLARLDLTNVTAHAQLDLLMAQIRATLGLPSLGTVDVLSWQGIVSAQLTLLDLLEVNQLGIGSVDELLETQLTAAQVVGLTAAALNRDGLLDTAAQAALGEVVTASGSLGSGTPTVRLRDLVDVAAAPGAALLTTVNAFDLIAGSVAIANGGHFADVQLPVNVDLPVVGNISDVTVNASVISPPKQVCVPVGSSATTSNVHVQLGATIDTALDPAYSTLVPTTCGNAWGVTVAACLNPGQGNLSLTADLAQGTGTLTGLRCDPDGMTVDVDGAVLTTSLAAGIPLSGEVGVKVHVGGLVNVEVTRPWGIRVDLATPAQPQTVDGTVDLDLPPNDTQPESVAGGLDLSAGLTATVTGTAKPDGSAIGDQNVRVTLLGGSLIDLNSPEWNQLPLSLIKGLVNTTVSTLTAQVLTTVNNLVGPGGAVSTALNSNLSSIESQLLGALGGILGRLPIGLAGVDVWGVPDPQCAAIGLRG